MRIEGFDSTCDTEKKEAVDAALTLAGVSPIPSADSTFFEKISKIGEDIKLLKSQIRESLVMGDKIFGEAGSETIINEVNNRNIDLKNKEKKLKYEISKKEAIINKTDRDFSDVNDLSPEFQKKKLNVFEDYTIAFVIMAYLFMIISLIYLYSTKALSLTPGFNLKAFIQSIFGSIFLTCFMSILLYYFS